MIRVDNVEEIAQAYPDTFRIPSREMRVRLREGDLVKLHFLSDGIEGAERMWVKILRASSEGYVGVLDSEPIRLTETSSEGPIEFGPEHVASIWVDADHDWERRIAAPAVVG